MNYAIGRGDVRDQNPRGVDEELPILQAESDVGALSRCERRLAVGGDEVSAESDLLREDVIGKDACQVLRRQGADCRADGLECIV